MDHHQHHHHHLQPNNSVTMNSYSDATDDYNNIINNKISDNQSDLLQPWANSQDQFINLINVDGAMMSNNKLNNDNMAGGPDTTSNNDLIGGSGSIQDVDINNITGIHELLYPRLSVRELLFADEAWEHGLNQLVIQQQQQQQVQQEVRQESVGDFNLSGAKCEHDVDTMSTTSSHVHNSVVQAPPLLPLPLGPLSHSHFGEHVFDHTRVKHELVNSACNTPLSNPNSALIPNATPTPSPSPNPNNTSNSTFMQQMIQHDYRLALNPSSSNPHYEPNPNNYPNPDNSQNLANLHQLADLPSHNYNMLNTNGHANMISANHQLPASIINHHADGNNTLSTHVLPSNDQLNMIGNNIPGSTSYNNLASFRGGLDNVISNQTRDTNYSVNPQHRNNMDQHHHLHQQLLLINSNNQGPSSSTARSLMEINTTATATNPQYTMITNHSNNIINHNNQSVLLSNSGSKKLSRISSSMEDHDQDSKELILIPNAGTITAATTSSVQTQKAMTTTNNNNSNLNALSKHSTINEEYNYKRSRLDQNANNNSSNTILTTQNNSSTPPTSTANSSSFKSSNSSGASNNNSGSNIGGGAAAPKKEKLGERITTLQQLVSPFGKTDTASVLLEAIGYIKFLQDQVQALSSPYLKGSSNTNINNNNNNNVLQTHLTHHQGNGDITMQRMNTNSECEVINSNSSSSNNNNSSNISKNNMDLRSRGLCLVPLSYCTSQIIHDINGADYWSYGGAFR